MIILMRVICNYLSILDVRHRSFSPLKTLVDFHCTVITAGEIYIISV
jgi:hypothetical protein